MSAVDANLGLLYQTTCRRPTWPFEDWRYDVLTKNKDKDQLSHSTDGEVGTWYTAEECGAIVEVLQADSQTENYPFRKQRLAGILQKTLNTHIEPKKKEKPKLSDAKNRLNRLSLAVPFFDALKTVCIPEYPVEICKLRTDVLEVLEDAAIYLRQTNTLFDHCDIVPIGSLGNDYKRLNSDEVDFFIRLPALSKAVKHARMCDETDLLPTLHLSLEEDKNFPIDKLVADLETALTKCMKPEWTLDRLTNSPDGRVHHFFIRVHKNETEFSEMKLDACFVLPLGHDKLFINEEKRADKFAKVPLQNYTSSFLELHDSKLCAILGPPWENHKTAHLLLEKDMAALLKELDHGVVYTYQLAEMVIALLFPQVFQGGLWKTIVPASVLQNLVLYLSEYHKDKKFWAPGSLHRRLIEVLLLLERCAQDEAVDLFLLPGMEALPLYTSYAYYYDAKRSRFLSADETHNMEPYECRILEEQLLKAFSKLAHVSKFLVPYIKHMKTQNWTFLSLLGDLILGLQSIFYCTVLPFWNESNSSALAVEGNQVESKDSSQSASKTNTRKAPPSDDERRASSAASSATSRRSGQRTKRARRERERPLSKCCPLM